MVRFQQHWSGWYESPRWKRVTSDGLIPFQLFEMLLDASLSSEAVDELIMTRAVALGKAMSENGTDARVRAAQRSLQRRGYPEIVEYPKEGADG